MAEPIQSAVQNSNILVVDDEPEIRQMMMLCLRSNGFTVTCAESAEDACKLLITEQFDVVISDVMMPGEDGISFLGRIHEAWPELPVILMTGHAQLQMAVNAIKNGAFDFIHKPFDFDYLRKIVIRAVNYHNLQKMEKDYRHELENTVALRTAELKESMAELDYARAALQQTASEKTAFMSTISHEMRTPMNGVIGSLELLAEEGLTGAAAEYLMMARQSSENMMLLINQLLAFNAPDAPGNVTHLRDLLDLHAFFESIVEERRSLFITKGIALSLHMDEGLPSRVWSDREKLSRLFEILFDNALKFTKQGSVSLTVSRICPENGEGLLCCTLSDSGIGIPEGMLERIFEPFVQGDGSLSRRYEGVGLGLAIARQNALLLNGNLRAEHNPGGGSRFILNMKISTP